MTPYQARVRLSVHHVLIWLLLIGSLSILGTALAKGIYFRIESGCSFAQPLCNSVQGGIAWLVNRVFFLSWIWTWLPYVDPDFWYLALLNSTGLTATFFFLFAFFLSRARQKLSLALAEADHRARVENFGARQSSQTIGHTRAGGDITGNISIEQRIGSDPEIKNWDNSFFKSPMGQVIIAATGGFLSFLAGKIMGN